MRSNALRSPNPPAAASRVGDLLREWRAARRMSQLDLALEANVSSRHLSWVETGKSQPGRELVEQLADALEMPLRERNGLLIAAGYAPKYRETALADPEMALLRKAVEFIIRQQEPFPAFVIDRHWDVLMVNAAMQRVFGVLKPGGPMHGNILRQVFDPADMRPLLANWEEVAGDLIRHLHHEAAAAPSDMRTRALLAEVLSYPDVPQDWRRRELGATPLPVITTVFRKDDLELRFFSTLTTFGTAQDVTVEGLRIECMFPADEATEVFCRSLAD
jgi:transcriptional regulator with XRE-family HTH domain